MKKIIFFPCAVIAAVLYACSGNNAPGSGAGNAAASTAATTANGNPSYDPERGEGKFTAVSLNDKLDATMAAGGEKIYNVKCSACHKLTTEKLVGPGWQGVTTRHKPEWIMNFITNTDKMIDKDPKAQAMLEICLVRMPNQNLSDEDARSLLEFMRKNDGIK
ncbi:MAG TPA: cytochrome c [Chitinophagaceae bacterium]|nr:cytochrome c [Chitinophagaceae bacterium]